jgi:hypothetical protein
VGDGILETAKRAIRRQGQSARGIGRRQRPAVFPDHDLPAENSQRLFDGRTGMGELKFAPRVSREADGAEQDQRDADYELGLGAIHLEEGVHHALAWHVVGSDIAGARECATEQRRE